MFHHNAIEKIMRDIIITIEPKLQEYIDNNDRVGFNEKFRMMKSLLHEDNLKDGKTITFEIIQKINEIRNKMAHGDYKKAYSKIETLLNYSFDKTNLFSENITKKKIQKFCNKKKLWSLEFIATRTCDHLDFGKKCATFMNKTFDADKFMETIEDMITIRKKYFYEEE